MPQFTFDGVVAGPSRGSLTNPQSTGQTFQLNDTTPYIPISFLPDESQSNDFSFVGLSFLFTGAGTPTQVENFVTRIGHNTDAGGSPVDAARPKLAIEFEQNYFSNYSDAGRVEDILVSEWHLAFKRPGVAEQRPITFFGRWNVATAATPSTNNLKFLVQQVEHKNAANDTFFWTCDNLVGFKIYDLPLSVNTTTVATNLLSLNAPTSQSGRYLSMAYNAAEWGYITRFGELALDTSATGAGASVLGSSLYVRGRTSTGNNLGIFASDGNARIRVTQGTGATGVIIFNSQFQNYGQFDQYNAAGSTLNFQIGATGTIRTNQWTTASALGALNGVIPITDNASGTVKYVATYASFTP